MTSDDILSHAMMLSAANNLLYILVEGDTDCSVIDPHLNADVCDTLPSGGKSVVLGAIALAREEGFNRFAAVVDLDWAGLLYPKLKERGVFYTDHYDIDAMVFFREQNVLSVTASFADRKSLRSHVAASRYNSMHEIITQIAFPLGVMRHVSEKHRLELSLRDFPISAVIEEGGDSIDFDRFIDLVIKRSPRCSITRENLFRLYEEEATGVTDVRRYCSGHDLLVALAVVLHRKCGSKASKDVIARAVRGAYGCSDAKESQLFRSMNEWGLLNGKEMLSCL
ncbi:hypothetical protein ACFWZK_22005 [[Kitasatospora] papulosa]|uniref:hypothetical protein n=1 Tax=[Kitasatospora] papulosa TaxID=1464011 RepID=UPI00367BDE94